MFMCISAPMPVCIFKLHVYIRINIHIHTYIHMYMCIYIYMCVCARVFIREQTHTRTDKDDQFFIHRSRSANRIRGLHSLRFERGRKGTGNLYLSLG